MYFSLFDNHDPTDYIYDPMVKEEVITGQGVVLKYAPPPRAERKKESFFNFRGGQEALRNWENREKYARATMAGLYEKFRRGSSKLAWDSRPPTPLSRFVRKQPYDGYRVKRDRARSVQPLPDRETRKLIKMAVADHILRQNPELGYLNTRRDSEESPSSDEPRVRFAEDEGKMKEPNENASHCEADVDLATTSNGSSSSGSGGKVEPAASDKKATPKSNPKSKSKVNEKTSQSPPKGKGNEKTSQSHPKGKGNEKTCQILPKTKDIEVERKQGFTFLDDPYPSKFRFFPLGYRTIKQLQARHTGVVIGSEALDDELITEIFPAKSDLSVYSHLSFASSFYREHSIPDEFQNEHLERPLSPVTLTPEESVDNLFVAKVSASAFDYISESEEEGETS